MGGENGIINQLSLKVDGRRKWYDKSDLIYRWMEGENGMPNQTSLQVDGRRKWYGESLFLTGGWEEKMVL